MNQDEWLNFWFKPQLYMHNSWFCILDEKLLNRQSSSIAWHACYEYICDCYVLPQEYSKRVDDLAGNMLNELLKGGEKVLEIASMMISNNVINRDISISIQRRILHRSRALSLRKRFLNDHQNLKDNEPGIYFVFLAITRIAPEIWSRFRMIFPRESVENVENTGKKAPYSSANDNAIRRAWKEIFSLKQELYPD